MDGSVVMVFLFLCGLLHCTSADLVSHLLPVTNTSDLGVTFKLYNRNYTNGTLISSNDTKEALRSVFLIGKGCKFITHGYLEDADKDSVVTIQTAYLRTTDYNVIAVDWSPISKIGFISSTLMLPEVGRVIAEMVIRLIQSHITQLNDVHLIGHSLGSHVVGFTGAHFINLGYGMVSRITGLDPGAPTYEGIRPEHRRLNKHQGQFIDVIHTSIGVFGYKDPIGDVDFYPNGGYNNQPGCTLTLDILCGHHRSYLIFAESIYNEHAFPAVKCDSYESFKANKCAKEQIVYMGDPTPSSATGMYFEDTNFTGDSIPRTISQTP